MKLVKLLLLASLFLTALYASGQGLSAGLGLLPEDLYSAPVSQGPRLQARRPCPGKCAWLPERVFRKKQWDLQLGLGLVPVYLMDKARIVVPPVGLGLEYRINEFVSLGGQSGYSISESQPYSMANDVTAIWTNRYLNFRLKPGFHITRIEGWDFYGGFSFGMDLVHVDGRTDGSYIALRETEQHLGIRAMTLSPAFSGFTGFRYVLTPSWTVGGELASGISLVTFQMGYLLNPKRR